MKKVIVTIVVLIFCATLPAMSGNLNSMQTMQVDPNDKAVVTLLWMVYSDLQMCQASMNKTLMDNISAIGHLNNARSALRKSNLDPAYSPLICEIDKRIGKIKFYLVMNDRRAVVSRLNQLMLVIRNVMGGGNNLPQNGGYYNGYNGYNGGGYNNGYNGQYSNPNGSGFVPVRPEIPVGGSFGGSSHPSMPSIPSGVVPVR